MWTHRPTQGEHRAVRKVEIGRCFCIWRTVKDCQETSSSCGGGMGICFCNPLTAWCPQTYSLQNYETISTCLNHPVPGPSWWQPWQTETKPLSSVIFILQSSWGSERLSHLPKVTQLVRDRGFELGSVHSVAVIWESVLVKYGKDQFSLRDQPDVTCLLAQPGAVRPSPGHALIPNPAPWGAAPIFPLFSFFRNWLAP